MTMEKIAPDAGKFLGLHVIIELLAYNKLTKLFTSFYNFKNQWIIHLLLLGSLNYSFKIKNVMANVITVNALSDYDGVALTAAVTTVLNVANIQKIQIYAGTGALATAVTQIEYRYIVGRSERAGQVLVTNTVSAVALLANAALV